MVDERDGAGALVPDEKSIAERIDDLVRRGLERYADGDFDGAVFDWEHALTLNEDDVRAQRYVEYVRSNYEMLSEAGIQPPPIEELAVPFGVAGSDADDDYEVELTFGGSVGSAAPSAEVATGVAADIENKGDSLALGDVASFIESAAVDAGWFLTDEETAVKLPPPPSNAELDATEAFDALELAPSLGRGGAETGAGERFVGDGGPVADSSADQDDLEPEIEIEAAVPPQRARMAPLDFGGDEGSREQTPTAPAMSARALADVDLGLAQPLDFAPDPGHGYPRPQTPEPVDVGDFLSLELGPPGGEPMPSHGASSDRNDQAEPDPSDELVDEPTRERSSLHLRRPEAESVATAADDGDDDEFTVPGAELSGDASPPSYGLDPDALRELSNAKGVRAQQIEPEEITVERPGIMANVSLGELEALNRGAVRDDRAKDPGAAIEFRTPDDEQTIERGAAGWAAPRPPSDGGGDEVTRERRELSGLIDVSSTRAPTMDPFFPTPPTGEVNPGDVTRIRRVIVDRRQTDGDFDGEAATRDLPRDEVRRALGGGNAAVRVGSDVGARLLAEIDDGAPANESEADRARRRVTELLLRAGDASRSGDQITAIEAVELAFTIDSESAASQMAIHRHRDLIIEIFERFLGDQARLPTLTVPIHELAKLDIDSRGAFLLSRIDGSLTIEEILDVAGMATLDAYRYLCKMLARGILQIR